jgi:hypothetical protein
MIGGKMSGKIGEVGWLIAIAAILMAVSCATPQIAIPTQNLDLIRTEAVQTAQAQMTKEALLAPSIAGTLTPTWTPIVFTATPEVATATASISGGSSTGGSSSGSSSSSGGVVVPTWTPSVYQAKIVGEYPLDGYPCLTGNLIDKTWTIQNTGGVTWDKTVYYIHLRYNNPNITLTKYTLYHLLTNVAPGDKVTVTVDILCPPEPGGPFTTQWGLVNDNGADFAGFYFRFYTVLKGTAIPAPTSTPSPG